MLWSNIPGQAKNSAIAEEINAPVTTMGKLSKLTGDQLSSECVTSSTSQAHAFSPIHESSHNHNHTINCLYTCTAYTRFAAEFKGRTCLVIPWRFATDMLLLIK